METNFMPYCDGCPKMEPVVIQSAMMNMNGFGMVRYSKITCEHKKICDRIENHLRKKIEKEKT